MVNNKMIVTFMLIAVTSLAAVGCSDDNPVTPENPIDTAPLLPPSNLTAEMDKGKVILEWSPSHDHRTINYSVTRERNGDFDNLAVTPLGVAQFVDDQPMVGTSYYHVHALGSGGQISAPTSTIFTITLVRQPDRLAE